MELPTYPSTSESPEKLKKTLSFKMETTSASLKRLSMNPEGTEIEQISDSPEIKKVKEIVGLYLLEKPYKQLLIPCDRRADLDEKQIKVIFFVKFF